MTAFKKMWANASEDEKRAAWDLLQAVAAESEDFEDLRARLREMAEAETEHEFEVEFRRCAEGWSGAAVDGSPLAKCAQVYLRDVARGLDLILPVRLDFGQSGKTR